MLLMSFMIFPNYYARDVPKQPDIKPSGRTVSVLDLDLAQILSG